MSGCKRILVVEDNQDVREAIADVLRAEGYYVEEARDGCEGLAKLDHETEASLILLDLMMPEKNGWEFLAEFRQKFGADGSGHKVVAISSLPPSLSLEDATPLAVDGAIRKPLSLERILEQAQKYCEAAALLPN